MTKRVLILGGTGAMGTPLTEILTQKGFQVFVTSRQERHSCSNNLTYLKGNAKDNVFIRNIFALSTWDAVIDFMSYSTEEFRARAEMMLSGTKQYVFISSARVYSRSEVLITENTPRLLDVCKDSEYLRTDEYALAKARCEDILNSSGFTNWTIIRPSITYSNKRLQLGVLEKEGVFYRVLHGRSIVFSQDIADKITTMTWGCNVAEGIAGIIGQPDALSQIFHITEPNAYKWQEILDVYLDVLSSKLGKPAKVFMTDKAVSFKCGNKYQIIYCRYFNRRFDNTKISRFVKQSGFVDAKEGLRKCLGEFLEHPEFKNINWRLEALNDIAAGERTPISEINGVKGKMIYLMSRNHFDFMVNTARRMKHMLIKIRKYTHWGGGILR